MALLRMKEIREMTREAREAKLRELRDDLLHERGVAAMGGAPHSPGQIRALRKNVARLLTVAQESSRMTPLPVAPPTAPRKPATKTAPRKKPATGGRKR